MKSLKLSLPPHFSFWWGGTYDEYVLRLALYPIPSSHGHVHRSPTEVIQVEIC